MEFTVDGKVRELKFGIGFVRELDKIYCMKSDGLEYGMGLALAYPQLSAFSLSALANVIQCALPRSIKQDKIDEAIELYAEEHDGLTELFEDLKSGLETSLITKAQVLKVKEELDKENAKRK